MKRPSAEAVATAINGAGAIVGSPAEREEDDRRDQKEAHRTLKGFCINGIRNDAVHLFYQPHCS
jgi:hypothetical protein